MGRCVSAVWVDGGGDWGGGRDGITEALRTLITLIAETRKGVVSSVIGGQRIGGRNDLGAKDMRPVV